MRLRGAVRKVLKDLCIVVSVRHDDVTRFHRLGLENRSGRTRVPLFQSLHTLPWPFGGDISLLLFRDQGSTCIFQLELLSMGSESIMPFLLPSHQVSAAPCTCRYVAYFCNFGFYECNMMHTALKIAMIALAATIVESLPITDTFDDNVTVPLTCVAVGSLLFPA
jgi:hypothetical protein